MNTVSEKDQWAAVAEEATETPMATPPSEALPGNACYIDFHNGKKVEKSSGWLANYTAYPIIRHNNGKQVGTFRHYYAESEDGAVFYDEWGTSPFEGWKTANSPWKGCALAVLQSRLKRRCNLILIIEGEMAELINNAKICRIDWEGGIDQPEGGTLYTITAEEHEPGIGGGKMVKTELGYLFAHEKNNDKCSWQYNLKPSASLTGYLNGKKNALISLKCRLRNEGYCLDD